MAARKGTLETGAKVVKLSTGTDYVEFYGATYENVEYCLDTQFSIDITVTQVD